MNAMTQPISPASEKDLDEAVVADASTREHEEASPVREGKLLVFTRRGPFRARAQARDINARLRMIEDELEQLSLGFGESRDRFTHVVSDLRGRSEDIAQELSRAAEQAAQQSAEQREQAQAVEARLQEAVGGLQTQLAQATQALDAQQDGLARLQAQQQALDQLQQQLAGLGARQGSAIERMAAEAQRQIQLNRVQFEALNALHREMQGELSTLTAQQQSLALSHAALAERTTGLTDAVGGLAARSDEDRRFVHGRFRLVAGALAALALAVLGLLVYFQFFPSAVPESVGTRLSTLDQQMVGMGEVPAGMRALEARVGGLETAVGQTGEGQTSLAAAMSASTAEIERLKAELKALDRNVDDLGYRIDGPGTRGGGLTRSSLPLHDSQWLAARGADHYTIQLLGVYRQDSLIAYVNQNAQVLGEATLAYGEGRNLGRPWFNLFYGDYASYDAAQAALDRLPLRLRSNHPWIRRIGSLPQQG